MSEEIMKQLLSQFDNQINKAKQRKSSKDNAIVLDLSNQQLGAIPSEIFAFPQIEILNLSNNHLFRLPDEIARLVNLRELNVSSNHLSSLPMAIGELKNLEKLYINNNWRMSLPRELGNLTKLTLIEISNSGLSNLPIEIGKLRNLKHLQLQGNLELKLPPEILQRQAQEILNYYFSIDKDTGGGKSLSETKVLVVGQGSVGKTSLTRRLLNGAFDPNQPKTDGIFINQSQILGTKDANEQYRLNIWDFGGQEIMHATHQFFLTRRSLYILVLDSRLTQEENRVEYWLKMIQSFGEESPVIIVGNKNDQHTLDIDRTGLQKKYSNIAGIIETSAATGTGIPELQRLLSQLVESLPHVHDLLPETWFTVKTRLESLGRKRNYFTHDEFLIICEANGVGDKVSQRTLLGFLHDLGVILHFQDDPRLETLGILNPQWVTNGVYKIINSNELFQNKGVLTLPLLNKILDTSEYPREKRLFIVDMMKKFELCYDIEPDKYFLIPDLLPKDEPYTGEWDRALAFQYHYSILPTSIITRFIVRMSTFIHKTLWRLGVVLKKGDNTALIKADIEERKIYIWVTGDEDTRRDFLSAIRMEFDAIHKTIAKIEAVEKVPLPNAPEATPIDLTFLQRAASEGRESLPVQVGDRIIDLIVKEVLNRVEVAGNKNITINIGGNIGGNFIVGDKNIIETTNAVFETIYQAIDESSHNETEKQDLIAEVDEIKGEVVKGDDADESFLSRRLRNLKKMAPDIAEVALATLANPVAGLGLVVQKVAKKVKEETK